MERAGPGDRPGPPPGRPLDDVLDEHAELEEIVAQLAEASDRRALAGLLSRLASLLERHFAREEREDVLALMGTAAGAGDAAAQLAREHREIRAALDALARGVDAGGAGPLRGPLRRQLRSLLDRLREHDARETELLRETGSVSEPVRGAARPPSKALEVNLRRTAVGVAIPDWQRVLLELTAHLQGVHAATRDLLHEINHRYVGWEQTIEELHRRAAGDLGHYLAQPRAPEAVAIFCRLYEKALDEAAGEALRASALRRTLQYLTKVAAESGRRLADLDPPLADALAQLAARCAREPELAATASARLRRLTESLLASDAAPRAARRAVELLVTAVAEVQRGALAREDPTAWWRELGAEQAEPAQASPPPAVAALSHARLRADLARLEATRGEPPAARAKLALELPDAERLARATLDAAECAESPALPTWRNRIRRVRWLVHVLSEPALRDVHEDALGEIHRAVGHALRDADAASVAPLVREVFETLRGSGLSTSSAALTLIARLGTEALHARDPGQAAAFIDPLLDWDFAQPRFAGFTDEWRPRVDPAHVGSIRALLGVVESDPEAARPLLAALVVHLGLGGVFLADTDLFQRDVSRLLRSPIAPVYHVAKQLLRLLPVYFNDIGAEGELREVSSRIDEIGGRGDPLCHFLRKQCHVECSPEMPGLVETVARFWLERDREPLRRYVPAALLDALDGRDPLYAGVHAVLAELARGEPLETLLALEPDALETRCAAARAGSERDREKVRLLLRLRRLLGEKYELRHDDVLLRLASFPRVAGEGVDALRGALERDDAEAALDVSLSILEDLKERVLSGEPSEAQETIYRKRHIAVGIPSLYGSYREDRFEAVGLGLRLESLASSLFARLLGEADLRWPTRDRLEQVARWLRLLLRALRVDGCRGRGLASSLSLLEHALASETTCVAQYVNVFQMISRSVEQIVRVRFRDVYEPVLDRVVPRLLERGVIAAAPGLSAEEARIALSEGFLRDQIARSFGLQALDGLVARVVRSLARIRDGLEPATAALLVRHDARHTCVELDARDGEREGALSLGNKGFLMRRMVEWGLPVPPGFVLTTGIFRSRPVLEACPELAHGVLEELRRQVARLERLTGCRLGDPRRPLVLSVRSSSAISMPGMLDTFLNVGMNEAVAAGLARRTGSPWAAWDAYRRFLQLHGMARGVERDAFDALIRDAKQRHGAAKKVDLPADRMRELALRYRDLLRERGADAPDEPFAQLLSCVDGVLRSWDAEKARIYRGELGIADAWGTAVIVQAMVYGNLRARSGTGVAVTGTPAGRPRGICLRGDFVVQGQGDDVVSGLVETHPIATDERPSALSLQRDFPAIHHALARCAHRLVHDRGMFHQEIEFTFESDDPRDLYVLQTRDAAVAPASELPAFVAGPALESARMASGIGAGGGALSGRVAHDAADVEALRRRFPGEALILLRPDTVPDDVPLVLRCDGILTALGGATSHAALVAQRLGRTCVVGCRKLEVGERSGRSRIAGHELVTGDLVSIDGADGSVYLGRHPTVRIGRPRPV